MTETVREVIEILNRVENKDLPLIFVTKHIEDGDLIDDYLRSGHPNLTAYKYDNPKEVHLELLPIKE